METKVLVLIVKEGDNNTRFFHRVANSHRRTNYLRGIEVDGVLYEDEEKVQSKVVHFYQSLYTESNTWRPSMDGLEFSSIEEDEQLESERDFSKEEVVKVLRHNLLFNYCNLLFLVFLCENVILGLGDLFPYF